MQIDWPGIRAAAVAIGVREAARRAGADLPEIERNRFVERVMKRCSTEKWLAVKGQSPANPQGQAEPPSANIRNGAESLQVVLAERKETTKLHLSKYVVDASKRAAGSKGNLKLSSRVREVAQVASHVWPEAQGEGDTVNLQVLSIGGAVNLTKR